MIGKKKECVAMLLAGGQGTRLGVLTRDVAKPAVPFGGKYRIIDFPLSNCTNSGIDTVGVLTQYQPFELNQYIANGQPWDLDRMNGGVFVLPPYMRGKTGEWYKGTANAIFQNINFIDGFDPDYVLILSGDHIYKMDYDKMLDAHKKNNADCTIAVIDVPLSEAKRFGIMQTDETGRITDFFEKPQNPTSTKASMGVYIFSWKKLRDYLIADENDPKSKNDFGGNIIPNMLNSGCALYAYGFDGYWKDVGTVYSLWEANMDLFAENSQIKLDDPKWKIYARNSAEPPQFVGVNATVKNSIVSEGCSIDGDIKSSVIFHGVKIARGARVQNSIVMPGATIEAGAVVKYAVIGQNAKVGANATVGGELDSENDIAVIGANVVINEGATVDKGAMLEG